MNDKPVNLDMIDDFESSNRLKLEIFEAIIPLKKLDNGKVPLLFVYCEHGDKQENIWNLLLGPTGSQYQVLNLTDDSLDELAKAFTKWAKAARKHTLSNSNDSQNQVDRAG